MVKLKTSFIAYVQNYILVALLCLVLWLLYLSFGDTKAFSVAFFVGLIICIYLIDEPIYKKIAYTYEVEKDFAAETRGIITKQKITIPYNNVSSIELKKGVMGRIFNFGDIEVVGFSGKISMVGIKNPEKVYEIIKKRVSLERKE